MTITTFLNENLAWIVIGALVIGILLLIFKKKKEYNPNYVKDFPERNYQERDYFQQINKPLRPVYPEHFDPEKPEPRLTNPQNVDYFNELERQNEEYQRANQKLLNLVNKPEMKKWNPDMKFPEKKKEFKQLPKPEKPKRKILPILAVLFVLAIVIISLAFYWGIKNDKFKSLTDQNCLSNLTCPNISCPSCPANPSCPACPSCPSPQVINNGTFKCVCGNSS